MACVFNKQLLHPRNWLTWFGLGILWLIVQLPYPLLHFIGTSAGRLSRRFLKRREHIARRNIELCFPDMSPAARETLIDQNFMSLGMGLIETGMAWFWPTHRVARWTETSGVNEVVELLEEKQGILLIGIHFLTLEMGARMYGMFTPGIGVYRPNDNPLIDWLQTWGRLRSNKTMLDRKNLKGMVRALKEGEILWYAPDHDYGPASSVFAPLFAVEQAATTTGTWMLAKMSGATIVPFVPRRKPNGMGYELISLTPERTPPLASAEVIHLPPLYTFLYSNIIK